MKVNVVYSESLLEFYYRNLDGKNAFQAALSSFKTKIRKLKQKIVGLFKLNF